MFVAYEGFGHKKYVAETFLTTNYGMAIQKEYIYLKKRPQKFSPVLRSSQMRSHFMVVFTKSGSRMY